MKRLSPSLIPLLLLAAGFTVGATLQPQALSLSRRAQSESVLNVLLGDGRRLFADHFFVKADVSLHSGYYPSIFDQQEKTKSDQHAGMEPEHGEHEENEDFLGPPKDWVDRFGRHFRVTEHTHLSGGNEREILPWLKLSSDLDPQRVDTYTVAAYWLRQRLGKVDEAEQFLREGLRNNPHSYEILFELGQLQFENRHDPLRARNLWQLALRRWQEQEPGKKDPDKLGLDRILMNLAHLEHEQGNWLQEIEYLERAKTVSPHPESLQEQIVEARQKLSGKSP